MDDIVFVRTRHNYQSYTDFWKLVELSKFPVVYTDEVDIEQQKIYIVCPMNGEWKPVIDSQRNKTKKARLIQWNLERPSGSGGTSNYIADNELLVENGYFDEVWISDRRLAELGRFSYAILGGHVDFIRQYDAVTHSLSKKYDFIHLSYNSPRRSILFNAPGVCKSNLNGMKIAPNAWGYEKHIYLSQSKFMLNIHQDEYLYIEPLRFVVAAMYRLPIITEYCLDSYPYIVIDIGRVTGGRYVLEQFQNSLLEAVNRNYDDYMYMVQEQYKRMTEEYTFRKAVEAIL